MISSEFTEQDREFLTQNGVSLLTCPFCEFGNMREEQLREQISAAESERYLACVARDQWRASRWAWRNAFWAVVLAFALYVAWSMPDRARGSEYVSAVGR